MGWRKILKKIWWFIAEDDSAASWVVNIILAFVLIKYIVYPGLGLVLWTSHPVVAVVSGSMEHGIAPDKFGRLVLCGNAFEARASINFDSYWGSCGSWYEGKGISKSTFNSFRYSNGFNTGDIMVLRGVKSEDIRIGDIIVFRTSRPEPIIHRVVSRQDNDGKYYFQTKGDHNKGSNPDEMNIREEQVIGKALVRVRLLGWVKILFVKLIGLFGVGV